MSKKTALLVAVTLASVAADQFTKYLAVARLTTALEGREGLSRVAGFFSVKNLDNIPREQGRKRIDLKEKRVIKGYWDFRYVENPGAAWGTFANLPDKVRAPFFIVISLIALVFIFWMYRRVAEGHLLLQWALSLVMGGAWGNFIDRLARGYVIDFIDWHWRNQPGLRWPTFNVADAAISVGVTLMVLDALVVWLRARRAERTSAIPEAAPPAEP